MNRNVFLLVMKLICLVKEFLVKKIKPDPKRLEPLLALPLPETKSDLQKALEMFSYYANWIQNFSDKICPLVQSNLFSFFPFSSDVVENFKLLRQNLASACLTSVKEGVCTIRREM